MDGSESGRGAAARVAEQHPVVRSQVVDDLADEPSAAATLHGWGGPGTTAELAAVRAALQNVVRAQQPAGVPGAYLTDVAQPQPSRHRTLVLHGGR